MKKMTFAFVVSILQFVSLASGAAEMNLWQCTANKNVDSVPAYGEGQVPYPKLYLSTDGAEFFVNGSYPNGKSGLHIPLQRA